MQASTVTVRARRIRYGSLFVSAHGEFNELKPWLSGFWLSDPAHPEGKGALVAATDIAGMDLRAQLLTIRACEVGLGRVINGEGFTGLSRALRRAGARHLVLSLGMVDDASSAELMTSFYRGFAKSDYPVALHKAKLLLKEAPGTAGRSPPFFLSTLHPDALSTAARTEKKFAPDTPICGPGPFNRV